MSQKESKEKQTLNCCGTFYISSIWAQQHFVCLGLDSWKARASGHVDGC